MDDRQSKAFDFAQETTKQLVGLSTGLIALTITFGKDFLTEVPAPARAWAIASWAAFLAAVLFGVVTLMALSGSLDHRRGPEKPSIYDRNIVVPATLQVLSFLLGLGFLVAFAARAVG